MTLSVKGIMPREYIPALIFPSLNLTYPWARALIETLNLFEIWLGFCGDIRVLLGVRYFLGGKILNIKSPRKFFLTLNKKFLLINLVSKCVLVIKITTVSLSRNKILLKITPRCRITAELVSAESKPYL